MAAPNIVYLPGIFGSVLQTPPIALGYRVPIWPAYLSIVSGGLLNLQLAPDGVSPGPLSNGYNLSSTGLIDFEYGLLGRYMEARGWAVFGADYDWRLSVRVSAPQVLAAVQAVIGTAPFITVSHSMGGLVARAIYRLLQQSGQEAQMAGMVTLGTPHFGSWEAVRGFFGLPILYNELQKAAQILGPYVPGYRVDFLDVILASWPGWYELLPWRDSGPLHDADPATAAALYQAATYAGGNPYLVQHWLDEAAITQDYLAPGLPPNTFRCVRGTNFLTSFEADLRQSLALETTYVKTDDGDGQVPLANATATGAINLDVPVEHGKLPLDWRVWAAVVWAVQSIAGPGA